MDVYDVTVKFISEYLVRKYDHRTDILNAVLKMERPTLKIP